jgi:hypothetical protein
MTTIPPLPFSGQQLRDTLSSLDEAIDGKESSGAAAAAVAAHTAAPDPHPGYLTAAEGNAAYATAAQGAKADTAIQPDNAALSDSREWSAATVSQAEAEAGSSTSRRAFTPQRVFQAAAAWWAGSAFATKLAGIATGATANATDAQLRDRATHTGTQAVGTITGLGTAATLNHGTAAGNVVRLDPTTGRLPAVDGSQLTNLPTGGGGVSAVTAAGLLTSTGGATPEISTSLASDTLMGRASAGTGVAEAISIGAGLAISGGALVATGGGTGGGSGTVTSVGLSLPGIFTVAGSPVTAAGTLSATLANQDAGLVFAGPGAGGAATPGFRALVTTDLPAVIAPATALTVPNGAAGSPGARQIYAVADTLRYRDSGNAERLLLNAADNLANLGNAATARTNLGLSALATAAVGSGLSLSGGTLSATGGGGGGGSNQQYAVNHWISPVNGAAATGAPMQANAIVLHPFVLARSVTIGELGARVNTAVASTSIQLAIYGSANGEPDGAPLATTASLSSATATTVSDNVADFNLTGGVTYWMAVHSDGAPTLQVFVASNLYTASILGAPTLAQLASAASSVNAWRRVASTFGTWPTLSAGATSVETTAPRGGIVYLYVTALL